MITDGREQGLFRAEALDSFIKNGRASALLKPPDIWTWWIILTVSFLIFSALAIAAFASVEVNVRAPAIVQSEKGLRPIVSQVSGVVSYSKSVAVFSVGKGDRVATVDVATQRSQILENDLEMRMLGPEYDGVAANQGRLHSEIVGDINKRIVSEQELIVSLTESLDRQATKLKALEGLAASKFVGALAVVDAREAYAQSERQLKSSRQTLAALHQELAVAARQRADDLWAQKSRLRTAEARRDALRELETQSKIYAPIGGDFEAMLKDGETIQPGQPIGRVVPKASSRMVVAYLAEKDRAFVKVGDSVRLELSQLPYGEFGTLGAKVARISLDLAQQDEIRKVFGAPDMVAGPAYRVDLIIDDPSAAKVANIEIKSGMLTQARFTLRHQRVAAIILEPLRRWLR